MLESIIVAVAISLYIVTGYGLFLHFTRNKDGLFNSLLWSTCWLYLVVPILVLKIVKEFEEDA